MRSFRVLYDECLQRQPLLTKMATSSVFFGLGDRLAQRVEKLGKTDEELSEIESSNTVQEGRVLSESTAKTVRMMVWGGLLLSPMVHNWHNLLERVFVGTGKAVVVKKVVADMVFVAPQIPIWFLTSTGFMAGKPLRQAFDESVEKQPVMLAASYTLWPAVNCISYSVVPLQYRLLFGNVVNLGWSSFLSYMTNHPVPTLPCFKLPNSCSSCSSCTLSYSVPLGHADAVRDGSCTALAMTKAHSSDQTYPIAWCHAVL